MSNIISIELRDVSPFASGRRSMPRKLPILDAHDGDVYHAYRLLPEPQRPRVITRRFLSERNTAWVVSIHLSDDLLLSMQNSRCPIRHMEVVGNDNEWFVLSLRLSGDTLESVCDRDHPLGAHSCYMVRYIRGMNHVLRSVSQQPLVEACVTFRRSMLAEKLGLPDGELDRLLSGGDHNADPWFSRCQMTPEMARIVTELQTCSLTISTYRLYAEAKALELISLYLAQLQLRNTPHAPRVPASHDLQCLRQIKGHLEENYDCEPNIDDLCRLVGFNRRKLTAGFRNEFGNTIREYHQQVRMEIAKTLFREQSSNVSLVAAKIGYRYPGNFAKAFQRYTGMSPKAYVRSRPKLR